MMSRVHLDRVRLILFAERPVSSVPNACLLWGVAITSINLQIAQHLFIYQDANAILQGLAFGQVRQLTARGTPAKQTIKDGLIDQ